MIEFTQVTQGNMEKAVRQAMRVLPMKVGETVLRFANQRFREQNWVDNGTEVWRPRKPNAKRNRGRNLLVDSGRLRRSIRITRVTADTAAVGTDVPYAGVHNDGFRGTVTVKAHSRKKYGKQKEKYTTRSGRERNRTVTTVIGSTAVKSHSRKMNIPKRRYLGESATQNRQIERTITAEILKEIRRLQ